MSFDVVAIAALLHVPQFVLSTLIVLVCCRSDHAAVLLGEIRLLRHDARHCMMSVGVVTLTNT